MPPQSTIAEIQTQMQENHERNIKLKEENIELGHKLKSLVEQYEAREEVSISCKIIQYINSHVILRMAVFH